MPSTGAAAGGALTAVLPERHNRSDSVQLTDRYSAFTVAQLVLMDTAQFPQANNNFSFGPETLVSRRQK